MKIEGDDGYKVDHKEIAENLVRETKLAFREAEIYVLTEIADLTVQEAAEEIGISFGNASKKRNRIRKKIEEAEKTAELEI
ncbi:MAG: sigma factor-like helix-turn-helix DNA-binding protein [Candidatus Nanohaloarchaea archaeon]